MCAPEHSPMPYTGVLVLSRVDTIHRFHGVADIEHDPAKLIPSQGLHFIHD